MTVRTRAAGTVRPDATVRQSIAGVIFEAINDSPSNGLAGGVFGIVTNGLNNIGVLGYSTNSASFATGTYGLAAGPNSNAVYGLATSTIPGAYSTGVLGQSANGNGMYGISTAFDGVVGETRYQSSSFGDARSGVNGFDRTTSAFNSGVLGSSLSGIGISGSSLSGSGVIGTSSTGVAIDGFSGEVGVRGTNNSNFYAPLAGISETAGSPPLVADNLATGASLTFDSAGNLTITGTYMTVAPATASGVSKAARSATSGLPASFALQSSRPLLEDVGEGQLVRGVAIVPIDGALSEATDMSAPYSVFITPESDNDGVYVTEKTSHNFVVREARGGHSTFKFAYRIVAKPAGVQSRRLPMVAPFDSRRLGSAHRTAERDAPFAGRSNAAPSAVIAPRAFRTQ